VPLLDPWKLILTHGSSQERADESLDEVIQVQDRVIAALRGLDASAVRVKSRLAELDAERLSLTEAGV
jgi:hypothetical protein